MALDGGPGLPGLPFDRSAVKLKRLLSFRRMMAMLRVLGSRKRLCDGMTRRDLLQAGGASLLGLSAADLMGAELASHPTTGRTEAPAKNVILLFLYGAAS